MSFEENGYQVVKQAVNLEILELLAIEFQLLKDIEYYYKAKKPEDYQGDQQTPISFSKYGALCFESLMLLLKTKSSILQEKVTTHVFLCENLLSRRNFA